MRTMFPIGRSDDNRVCTTSFKPGARLMTLQQQQQQQHVAQYHHHHHHHYHHHYRYRRLRHHLTSRKLLYALQIRQYFYIANVSSFLEYNLLLIELSWCVYFLHVFLSSATRLTPWYLFVCLHCSRSSLHVILLLSFLHVSLPCERIKSIYQSAALGQSSWPPIIKMTLRTWWINDNQ